jgi:cobyrinic acid a,c-diamide synthase
MTARGLIIAAPQSGAGKTTITLALVAALRRRGLKVSTAKAGPDYIDPAFHAVSSGSPAVNLDSWAMPDPLLDMLAARAADSTDIFVVEGVMGLFDGAAAKTGRRGATADLAAHFDLPVVLVLDIARQAQSAAAIARGFAAHDPTVKIAGVILNRTASERHRLLVADAIGAAGLPVFGVLPRDVAFSLPERHLGLVQAAEHADLATLIERLAETAERHFNLEAIVGTAAPLALCARRNSQVGLLPPPGQRVAMAQDRAFSFVYPHVLGAWRGAGAEILPFSPLADEAPPEAADCCWLPGGYPELHAEALAAAQNFAKGLRRFAQTRPVHGECGGYMVLGQSIEDSDGRTHVMTGLLGHATSFAKRKLHLGYRAARLLSDSVLGCKGACVRGHEFHYASLIAAGADAPFAELRDSDGRLLGNGGGQRGYVSGTFFHAIAAGETWARIT